MSRFLAGFAGIILAFLMAGCAGTPKAKQPADCPPAELPAAGLNLPAIIAPAAVPPDGAPLDTVSAAAVPSETPLPAAGPGQGPAPTRQRAKVRREAGGDFRINPGTGRHGGEKRRRAAVAEKQGKDPPAPCFSGRQAPPAFALMPFPPTAALSGALTALLLPAQHALACFTGCPPVPAHAGEDQAPGSIPRPDGLNRNSSPFRRASPPGGRLFVSCYTARAPPERWLTIYGVPSVSHWAAISSAAPAGSGA
jgi:hypothetical protein